MSHMPEWYHGSRGDAHRTGALSAAITRGGVSRNSPFLCLQRSHALCILRFLASIGLSSSAFSEDMARGGTACLGGLRAVLVREIAC